MIRLWRFLQPYQTWVALVVVLTFAQTMSTLYLPTLMANIVDTGVIPGNVPYIIRVGLLMLLITVLGGVAAALSSLCGARATARFGQNLRSQLFAHVEHFTLREVDQFGTSSLIVRTTNDVMQVQQLVTMMLGMMVTAPLLAIGGVILAVRTDARLALTLVVAIPLLGLVMYAVLHRGLGLFRTIQTKVDRLNRVLRENLTGTRVIRAFHRTAFEVGRFDGANLDLTDTSVRVFQLMAVLMPAVMLVMNLGTVAMVWFGGLQINTLHLQIGQLMACIQYVMQVMFGVMMVSMMIFMLPRGEASAQRINEVLAVAPEIRDPAEPRPAGAERGRVEFRHVTFAYPGAEQPALADISFQAQAGEVTAIIGGTGAGKSTLLNLIPRFYDVAGGSVLIDGVDVREMSQQELRAKLGYVPQRAVLFTGSVLDNIRYGDLEASAEAVRHAAEVAQATEFVEGMPERFDAVLTQGGANLSGGQKQRLSIARALVRRAEIYLFDDSFSALDYRTEAQLRAALRDDAADATVLIVAQRVSSVVDADRIVVLDDGRVAGIGTHRDLLSSCPVYREIVSSQLSPEEVA